MRLLEGVITAFSDTPSQLSSKTERAMTNRVTLVVQVTMVDQVKKTPIFAQSFVGFSDYHTGDMSLSRRRSGFASARLLMKSLIALFPDGKVAATMEMIAADAAFFLLLIMQSLRYAGIVKGGCYGIA